MSPPISFELDGVWLDSGKSDATSATLGPLTIRVDGVPITEVHDALAQTTRDYIRVPLADVATWLCVRYWRLRHEPLPAAPSSDWLRAHSMASLAGGFAWPKIVVYGDGVRVHIVAHREEKPDVAAVRYLRDGHFEVSPSQFDAALDSLLDLVENRLAATDPGEHEGLRALREELAREREDSNLAMRCRREAAAGMDAGDADDAWHARVVRLAATAGVRVIEDMLAAESRLPELKSTLDAMARATTKIDLPLTTSSAPSLAPGHAPWKRGVQLAQHVRGQLSLSEGPVPDDKLSEILGLSIPVAPDAYKGKVRGAFRNGTNGAGVIGMSPRRTSQRFFLTRVLGLAWTLPHSEHVLPILDTDTSLQSISRAFAQELLAPWHELDAWTDEHGMSEEMIGMLADRYEVSEMLITTTLVNRGKLQRDRLASFY